LTYLKHKSIVHRDIKPQNTLFDNEKMLLKLCDFGSAKKIISGEDSISYIGFYFKILNIL
jgi:glycogen synthase kinase 3 beta